MSVFSKWMKVVGGLIWLLIVLNFIASFFLPAILGGTASAGKVEQGRYYLGSHGHYTAVCETTFLFLQYYENFWMLGVIVFGGGAAIYVFLAEKFPSFSMRELLLRLKQRSISLIKPFGQKTVLCHHCFQYTTPFKSNYKDGKRWCEHCQGSVAETSSVGSLVLAFGNFNERQKAQIVAGQRTFLLENPQVERKTQPMDIAKIYLDCPTTDFDLFEQFLTYLLNYPPRRGIQSIQVVYTGELHTLPSNLKNVLQNTFQSIERMPDRRNG
jgi:hypothetical protein